MPIAHHPVHADDLLTEPLRVTARHAHVQARTRTRVEGSAMLYMVHMIVVPPAGDSPAFEDAKVREKAYSQELQRSGRWPHLWRVVGQYANYSVFDAASNDE